MMVCFLPGGKGMSEAEEGARALLVGVYRGSEELPLCQEHLEELASLADTFGVTTSAQSAVSTYQIDPATYVALGKVYELKDQIEATGVTLLIFDEEISPAQQRNLEKLLQIAVMDRTELILEIFAQRAQTKEAKLQIELARTEYGFPRLKRLWSHFSRQRARGGYLKGEGEKQIEIDRRLLKKKLEKLTRELKEVQKSRGIQSRQRRRSGVPTFALIGYTNSGKSTLLKALTEAEVLVEDKLFATLDPTTRRFLLPNNQPVLLTDTVGFIRKLPHTLVAAFRSTLEAALHDDVLLHLVDISHPSAEAQAETTLQLLEELGIPHGAMITIFNKADRAVDPVKITRLRLRYPKSVVISAQERTGFDALMQLMIEEVKSRRRALTLRIPQEAYAKVAILHREGEVRSEEYEENSVVVHAEVPLHLLHLFEAYQQDPLMPV